MSDYAYLDQNAILDDSPWSSGLWRRQRTNIEHVRLERFAKGGHIFQRNEQPRLCSVHPVAWGPFWLMLPEPTATVTMRLYVNSVDYDGEADSTEAIDLHATSGFPGRTVTPPPLGPADWDVTLLRGVDDDTVQVFTVPVNGDRGWVGIYLWTWSRISETAEDNDTTSTFGVSGGVTLTGVTVPPASANYPERALRLTVDPAGKGHESGDAAPQMQIGYYRTSSTVAYTIPPFYDRGTLDWATYPQGVVEIEGIALESEAVQPDVPDAPAYYTDAKCSWPSHQNPVNALEQMVKYRSPTWMINPGHPGEASNKPLFWLLRSEDGTADGYTAAAISGDNGDDTDHLPLAATMIANPPPDSDGYTAIVSLFALHHTTAHELTLRLRLSAYNVTSGALITSGLNSLYTNWRISERGNRYGTSRDYVPLEHSLWGSQQFQYWQYRGGLMSKGTDYTFDAKQVQHFTCEIDETNLAGNYPLILKIEARVRPARSKLLYAALISAGIASKPKDIDLGSV